ncbi:MAG: ATP-binding protein [Motilibacteraceae bacterium]
MAKKERGGSGESASQTDRHGRLAKELNWLRLRGIERIDSREHVHREFPELDRLLEASHLGDGVERPIAMRALIERALTYCKNADALATLYGEVSDFTGDSPDSLYKAAAKAAGVFGEKSVQRWVGQRRAELARALLELEAHGFETESPAAPAHGPAATPVRAPSLPRLPEPHVPRWDDLVWLAERGDELIGAGAGGLIFLTGVAGSGKTTLALDFATRLGTIGAVGFIRLHRRGVYEDDLLQVLRLLGDEPASSLGLQPEVRLRRALAHPGKLSFLVLDDARSVDDVRMLIPDECPLPVLVTCQELPADLNAYPQVASRQLVGLGPSQSGTLLGASIDNLSDQQRDALIGVLAGHPESLALTSHALSGLGDAERDAFVAEMLDRTSGVLDDLGELAGAPAGVQSAVTRLVNRASERPLDGALLAVLAWATFDGNETVSALSALTEELLGKRPSDLAVRAAVRRLERLSLVTVRGTVVSMTGLTSQLVRSALASRAEDVMLALERLLRKPAPEGGYGSIYLDLTREQFELTQSLEIPYAIASQHRKHPLPRLISTGMPHPGVSTWAWLWTGQDGDRRCTVFFLGPTIYSMIQPGDHGTRPIDDSTARWLRQVVNLHRVELLLDDMERAETEEERADLWKQTGFGVFPMPLRKGKYPLI